MRLNTFMIQTKKKSATMKAGTCRPSCPAAAADLVPDEQHSQLAEICVPGGRASPPERHVEEGQDDHGSQHREHDGLGDLDAATVNIA